MRGGDRGRHLRRLSDCERALWRQVLRSVRPLRGASPPSDPEAEAGAGAPGEAASAAVPGQPQAPGAAPEPQSAGRRAIAPSPRPASAHVSSMSTSLSDLDRKTRRGLARGSVPVEARLDLHGLTQTDAYRELRQFLVHAQARGLRHVLVITGKGRRPNDIGEAGVLRRAVPEWLRQPELRPYVAMVGAAAAGHGGDGALYLRLARPVPPRRR